MYIYLFIYKDFFLLKKGLQTTLATHTQSVIVAIQS